MRARLPDLLLLLLLCCAGCATVSSRVACPAKGGAPWRELSSAHFQVKTDLEAESAHRAVMDLERFRSALLGAWGEGFDPPGLVQVILLRSQGAFQEFVNEKVGGYATRSDRGVPLLVMTATGGVLAESPVDRKLQAHELAHYLSSFALARQPRWLAEGLAGYLETTYLKAEGDEALLGRAHYWYLGYVRAHGWLGLEELWRWGERQELGEAELQAHYASAWLWVHYLLNMHPERFGDFQERLARAEEPRQAFTAAFAGVEDLGGPLRPYVDTGRYSVLHVPLGKVPSQVQVRDLSCAEVHALRATLLVHSGKNMSKAERLERIRREVELALGEDATCVPAVQLKAALTESTSERLALAQALVQARPDSGEAWELLARALRDADAPVDEQEAALLRATELLPQDAQALNALAWYHANRKEPHKALQPAALAVKLAPYNASILDTYALVLSQLGYCDKSVLYQRRALDVMSERASHSERLGYILRLRQYEEGCGQTTITEEP